MNKGSRKISSYMMLPLMVVYVLYPSIGYCDDSGTGNSTASNSSQSFMSASVDIRTGQLNTSFSLAKLSGIAEGMDIDLSLSNGGGDKNLFNLYKGWKYDLSYIDTTVTPYKIYMDSGDSYSVSLSDDPNGQFSYVDSQGNTCYSGLRYCTNKGINFKQAGSGLPSYASGAAYVLSYLQGDNQYFDSNGKVIAKDDRFGNHITYNYTVLKDGFDETPFNVRLTGITDSFGQAIKITDDGCQPTNAVTVTMPDGRTGSCIYSNYTQTLTIKDLSGQSVVILFNSDNTVNQVTYPTGGIVEYQWGKVIPNPAGGSISAVIQETRCPDPNNLNAPNNIITTYNYTPNGSYSYLGAGNGFLDYSDFANGKDALMETGDNSYRYYTQATQYKSDENGGPVLVNYNYNFLHLNLSEARLLKNSLSSFRESTNTYMGQDSNGEFPSVDILMSNYNMTSATVSTAAGVTKRAETLYDDYNLVTQNTSYNNGILAGQSTTQYDYDNNGMPKNYVVLDPTTQNTVSEINTFDPTGKYISKTTHNSNGSALDKAISYECNDKGQSVSRTLSCASANYGNPTASTQGVSYSPIQGSLMTQTFNDPLGNQTTKVIDISSGNLISLTDAYGNKETYSYSNNGLTVKSTFPDGSWEQYDRSNPNKEILTSSKGITYNHYYDGFSRLIKTTYIQSGSSSEVTMMTQSYNEMGLLASTTDAYGDTLTYIYNDHNNRMTSINDGTSTVSLQYDDALLTTSYFLNGIKVESINYDGNGNILKLTSYLSGLPGNTPSACNTYNGINQMVSNSILSENNTNTILKCDNTMDPFGRLTSAKAQTYDGFISQKTYEYNLFDSPVSSVTKYSAAPKSINITATGAVNSEIYTYDAAGRLTTVKDQAGNTHSYTYDKIGNLLTETDPSNQIITYSYDNMTRLTTMTGKEYKREIGYRPIVNGDAASGAIASILLYKNGTLFDKVSYGYDSSTGRKTSTTYYDGQPESKTMYIGYDVYGRITSVTDYKGIATTAVYDSKFHKRINNISNKYGSVQYTYYPATSSDPFIGTCMDMAESATYKDEAGITIATVAYTYYAQNEQNGSAYKPKTVTTTNAKGVVINSTTLTYDSQERILSTVQSSATDATANGNNIKKYTYNGLDALIKEDVFDLSNNPIYSTSYVYDSQGNVLSKTITDGGQSTPTILDSTTYAYNVINQLKSINNATTGVTIGVSYDSVGNMINISSSDSSRVENFSYDELNQLTAYNDQIKNISVYYDYNAETLRKSKYHLSGGTSSDKLTYYYFGKDLINETDVNGLSAGYLLAHDRILRNVGDNVEWYVNSAKDVALTLDSKGEKETNRYQFNAYGERIDLSNKGSKVVSESGSFDINRNPFTYSSYYSDEESGMYYLLARYYSPELMRFISLDGQNTPNKYAYGNGNPINNVDPLGGSAWDYIGLGAAMGFALLSSVLVPGSDPALFAFALGNMAAPSVSLVKDIKNKNNLGIMSDCLQMVAGLCGTYSAQPTYFTAGKDAKEASSVVKVFKGADAALTKDFQGKAAIVIGHETTMPSDDEFGRVQDAYIKENKQAYLEKTLKTPKKLSYEYQKSLVKKNAIYQRLSADSSQGLGGAATGISTASGKKGGPGQEDVIVMGLLGGIFGVLGGEFYSIVSGKLPSVSKADLESGKVSGCAYGLQAAGLGALRSGISGSISSLGNVLGQISIQDKINWKNVGIGVGSNFGTGMISGVTQSSVDTYPTSKLSAAGRNFYLFMKGPIINKSVSGHIGDYGNFGWK